MSYLRGACEVTVWDGESDESVYDRCDMESNVNGVQCGVVEWVKRNFLNWFGHIERMKSREFVNKEYVSEIVDPKYRGRPLRRWQDRVKEYMHQRDAARRGRWGFFSHGHPLGECSLRKPGGIAIDE